MIDLLLIVQGRRRYSCGRSLINLLAIIIINTIIAIYFFQKEKDPDRIQALITSYISLSSLFLFVIRYISDNRSGLLV